MNSQLSRQEAAQELLRRKKARGSLLAFVNAIDVPGRPISDKEDEWLFHPIETGFAAHHLLLLKKLDEMASGALKRMMVFMPPGSAKSTYASVVFPAYIMGRDPKARIILTSYASDIARKQGRRARQIARSAKFASIFGCGISSDTSAADEWSLTNGAEFMSGGILSGVTGNRASGLIIDDPVAGRQEADSETVRKSTRAAYEDDVLTRLVPGAWELIIQTRWNEADLSGSILPSDWRGESGLIKCRDGNDWYVLRLPAEADRIDDPLGRKLGESLWPEWFTDGYFDRYKLNTRTWSALYQQMPTPETGDYFKAEWLLPVAVMPPRAEMRVYMASDYAVTADGGDYTVIVVIGLDANGDPWLLDVWRKQASSDVWVDAVTDLILKWKPLAMAEETGQIKSGVGPFLLRRMREKSAYVVREQFPTRGGDKGVRARSFQGMIATRGLRIPRDAAWRKDVEAEMLSFPAGVHDDVVDALGLCGQLLDKMLSGQKPQPPKPEVNSGYSNAFANRQQRNNILTL